MSVLRRTGFFFLMLLPGCFVEPSIPACVTLADCPAGQGYTGCVDGWCYMQDACESRPVVSGDGCCAVTEGDRSQDMDCLLVDLALSCLEPAGPTMDSQGNVFVSCLLTDDEGGRNVAMRRLALDSVLSLPIVAGPGSVAFCPVKGAGATLFVQAGEVFATYRTDTLAELGSREIVTAIAPMSSNNGSKAYRSMSVWPGEDGRVHLYDENRGLVLSYGAPRPELAESGAFRPTMSWTGRRTYVTWKSGFLDVLETGSNPLGMILSSALPAIPAAPALDVDGFIYVLMMDKTLVRYRENAQARLDESWSLEIFDEPMPYRAWLLVRQDNSIVVVGSDGEVRVVRDMDTFGSVVAAGRFNSSLDDIHPVLAESGRVIAVSESGKLLSVLIDDENGVVSPGLEFNVTSRPASDLLLNGNSIVYVSETGSLMSWSYPDGPGTGRWSRAGGNNFSTGRTSVPDGTEVAE